MLSWSITFLIFGLTAAILGYYGIFVINLSLARSFFAISLALWLLSFYTGPRIPRH